jgi:hypothetical protein
MLLIGRTRYDQPCAALSDGPALHVCNCVSLVPKRTTPLGNQLHVLNNALYLRQAAAVNGLVLDYDFNIR